MKYVALCSLIFFISASLGFAVMCLSMVEQGTMHHCMVSMTECVDAATMAIQHIAAYQSFSSATVALFASLTIAIVALAVLFIFSYKSTPELRPAYVYAEDRWREDSYLESASRKKVTSWLSLFEHSPSHK